MLELATKYPVLALQFKIRFYQKTDSELIAQLIFCNPWIFSRKNDYPFEDKKILSNIQYITKTQTPLVFHKVQNRKGGG